MTTTALRRGAEELSAEVRELRKQVKQYEDALHHLRVIGLHLRSKDLPEPFPPLLWGFIVESLVHYTEGIPCEH